MDECDLYSAGSWSTCSWYPFSIVYNTVSIVIRIISACELSVGAVLQRIRSDADPPSPPPSINSLSVVGFNFLPGH